MAKIKGNDNANTLYGTGNDDEMYGYGGKDVMYGWGGKDLLDGGAGADRMYGGNGDDTYIVDTQSDKVYEYANEGIDTIASSVTCDLFYTPQVENLILTGSGADISGFGNTLDNVILGNSGDNSLFGAGGHDVLKGGGGDDRLYGNNQDGSATMAGGDDDDTYVVTGGDTVVEYDGEGYDTVETGLDYTLTDNVEKLVMAAGQDGQSGTGNALKNVIVGNALSNTINGGLDADIMIGGVDNDSYIVDNEGDIVLEELMSWDGHDIVYSYVDEVLDANVEELSLAIGNAISGIGNGGDNVLYGNTQDNFLNGGDGADQLSGLGGNDTFVFQAGQAQGDTVFEFEGNGDAAGDVLYFTGYGTAADGATFMQQNATDWVITSADGLISETITLSGAPAVGTLDYLFV